MSAKNKQPLLIEELLVATHQHCSPDGEKLTFNDSGLDVYNPTAPFNYRGRRLLMGRSQRREDTLNSQSKFYAYDAESNSWLPDQSLPSLPLEDPFIAHINGEWLLGGVKTYEDPVQPGKVGRWETWFYRGQILEQLTHFAVVEAMKDIRLFADNNHIDVLTRPQNERTPAGKIGYLALKSLDELNSSKIHDASIVESLFADRAGEWGGANQIIGETTDGWLDVLGHISRFNGREPGAEHRNREYFALRFELDRTNLEVRNQRIVSCYKEYPGSESKRQDTKKVTFPGEIVISGRSEILYTGVGDAETWRKIIAA